jgi:hypothetical protein
MKEVASIFALLLLIMTPTQSNAYICSTSSGTCAMDAGVLGAPCFCVTECAKIQGITRGGPPENLPHFCCTPAGRMGPYPDASSGSGAPCKAETPGGGVLRGQACY